MNTQLKTIILFKGVMFDTNEQQKYLINMLLRSDNLIPDTQQQCCLKVVLLSDNFIHEQRQHYCV